MTAAPAAAGASLSRGHRADARPPSPVRRPPSARGPRPSRPGGRAGRPGAAAGRRARRAAPPCPSRRPRPRAGRISAAAEAVARTLQESAATVEGERRELLETTAQMASDPTLVKGAAALVRTEHLPAPRAVWQAAGRVAEQLSALGGYMAERAKDVADVRNRIIAELTGQPVPGVPQRSEPFVLVATDLAPADTALLDPALVRAIVTAEGGPTSHTAILARSLGIPAVVGVTGASTP
ncbi:PEP-utilizing enzyme [Georgenia sp. SUBG003]|uniref:PEP-utilizing enzyme n=1 Tax=Georgenia sp. SUBG003 TaxID=1497974 RepID=UPI003AB4F78B